MTLRIIKKFLYEKPKLNISFLEVNKIKMKSSIKKLNQKNINSEKSSSNFSSLNKFDYPDFRQNKNIRRPTNKIAFQSEQKQKQNDQNIRKAKYYWYMRNQHHNQRDRVKENQQLITQTNQEKKKKQIMQKLQIKRQELQKLQKQRQQIIKAHGKAQQHAIKFSHQQDIKRLKSEQRVRQNHFIEVQRFTKALISVKSQKQLNNDYFLKRNQSIKRRDSTNLYKSRQRIQAQQYCRLKQQQQEQKMQQDTLNKQKQFKQKFNKNLLKKTGNTIDFEQSCFHNPGNNVVVLDNSIKSKESKRMPENKNLSSYKNADNFQQKYKTNKIKEQQNSDKNRKKSIQRNKEALQKLKQAKQYNQYIEEMQQKQLMYNLDRIQAGKRNHLIGVKSQTLNAYSKQKKQRVQEQFENIFITPTKKIKEKSHQHSQYLFLEDQKYNERTLSTKRTLNSPRSNLSNSPRNHLINSPIIKQIIQNKNKQQVYRQNEYEQLQNDDNQKPKHFNRIPYNSKINQIMKQKSLNSSKKVFQEDHIQKQLETYINLQNQRKNQQPKRNKYYNFDNQNQNYGNTLIQQAKSQEPITLDYSITEQQDSFY